MSHIPGEIGPTDILLHAIPTLCGEKAADLTEFNENPDCPKCLFIKSMPKNDKDVEKVKAINLFEARN